MTQKTVRFKAMDLLARREHSRAELTNKLKQREFLPDEIASCLDQLVAENLQSDERFCEAYVKMRSQRGFGPARVLLELAQKEVAPDIVDKVMPRIDWLPLAREAYQKKYREEPIADFKDRAKRMQFLTYRGYSHEQINQVMGDE